jgi:ketosteroid isomerase-like protein
MSDETTTALEQQARRVFELLDALDIDSIGAMLADDAQGVDEISRGWMRGRAALEGYFGQLKTAVSGPRSQLSDVHATAWGDVGLVTCVLDQTYKLSGREQSISAPTSMIFRNEDGSWKIGLIHTVPFPDQPDG